LACLPKRDGTIQSGRCHGAFAERRTAARIFQETMGTALNSAKRVVNVRRDVLNDVVQDFSASFTFLLIRKTKHIVVFRESITLACYFL
jgi:hypothetical protein